MKEQKVVGFVYELGLENRETHSHEILLMMWEGRQLQAEFRALMF